MSERRGFWTPLSNPWVYEAFHHLIGARRWLRRFAHDVIQPKDGDRVLDIGCGPGPLLRYLPGTTYVGFDYNQAYIEHAKQIYGDQGTFICDDVANFTQHALAPVDIAIAIGTLHHLSDDLALRLLRATANTLKTGGRFITIDPCFHPEQSFVQRLIVSNDRGMFVRQFAQYGELCRGVFPNSKSQFQKGYLPFPHSICTVQMTH